MPVTPCCDIDINDARSTFCIVDYAIRPDLKVAAVVNGETVLSADEFCRQGLELVLKSLDGFDERHYEPLVLSDEEWLERRKARLTFSVSRQDRTHLTVVRMHPIRGKHGYRGGATQRIAATATPKRLYALLLKLIDG